MPQVQRNDHSFSDQQIIDNVNEAKRDIQDLTPQDCLNENIFTNFVEEEYDLNALKPYTRESFLYIQDEEMLKMCTEYLEKHDVIGIDIENHRQTSYEGFMCLLQVSGFNSSSNPKSFVIDVLKVRSVFKKHFGQKILSNKNILKIFHGCIASDILWLQRDFAIQTQNVFDTQELSKMFISQKELSLAQFWEKYCSKLCLFKYDDKKQFQKADWSVRPLSKELLEYAAHDTYLLYHIAKQQFQEVIQLKGKNIKDLLSFYRKFNKKVMEAKYRLNSDGFVENDSYRKVFRKSIDYFDPESDEYLKTEITFKSIHNLREKLAKQLDINRNEVFKPNELYLLALKRPDSVEKLEKILTEANIQMSWLVRTQLVYHFIPVIACACKNFEQDKAILKEYYKEQGVATSISLNAQQQRQLKKDARRKDVVKNFTCKKAVYEDGRMLAPDGTLLSFSDHKKANWYVERGLAKIVSKQPLTIQLNFEPSGRDANQTNKTMNDDAFYQADRNNSCVRCGTAKDFSRFHIVPSLYRTHFPESLKSHRSHDVVLLCFACHEIANKKQEIVKRQLAIKYKVPLHQVSEHFQLNQEINSIKKLAISLVKGKQKIPEANRLKLETGIVEQLSKLHDQNVLDQVLKEENLQKELIEKKSEYENWTEPGQLSQDLLMYCFRLSQIRLSNNQKLNPHGSDVIKKIIEEGGDEALANFIKMWRQNFLDSLEPKHMPDGWDVDHKITRKFGDFSRFKNTDENKTD